MDRIVLPNDVLLNEVAQLLGEGREVVITPKGRSMLPFIRGDVDQVKLRHPDCLKEGDIVLAYFENRYVLHRIIAINGDEITLMGDGNLKGTEQGERSDVVGKVVEIKNGQAEVSLTPKAAGTLMDVDIDRDEEFNNKVNIWMDKAPTGLFLNPQLNEDERLTYKEENTWGVVISPLNEKGSTSYFILARGKQYFDADYYDENDQEWKELWWGQYVNIESGKKTMFYYDCHPQLMYKCYLGSKEKYADWKQAHDTKGLKLEPIVPFGTNLDVLEEAIHDSPFDINEEYEMRQIGSDWVKIHNLWPSGELVVVYFYETQDGKNAKACTYQYDGPLFPFEQMREEIVKWGYEYKGFFTDPTLQLPNYVYLTPDGKDEIQIWESVTSSGEVEGWQICLHPYDQEDFDRIAEQQNGSGN